GAEVHRPGPALAAAKHVETHVGGDAVEPGPHRGTALEAVDAPPGPHHRLLYGVLCLEARPEHAVAVAGELAAVLLEILRPDLAGDDGGPRWHCHWSVLAPPSGVDDYDVTGTGNSSRPYPFAVYRQLSVVLVVPVLDEAGKIGQVVSRAPRSLVDDVLVVDDGSTDGSREEAAAAGATVIALGRTSGVGAALRAGFERASAMGTDVAVVAAGNNKDAPEEIPRLLDPIVDDG